MNGRNGLPGRDGRDGEKGLAGPPGPRGVKGEVGRSGQDADHRNWKQCAWKGGDARDIGPIKVSLKIKIKILLKSTQIGWGRELGLGGLWGYGEICDVLFISPFYYFVA